MRRRETSSAYKGQGKAAKGKQQYAQLVSLLRIGKQLAEPFFVCAFFFLCAFIILPMRRKDNTFRIQGRRRKFNQIDYLILVVILCAERITKGAYKKRLRQEYAESVSLLRIGQHLLLSLPMRRRETLSAYSSYQIKYLIEPSPSSLVCGKRLCIGQEPFYPSSIRCITLFRYLKR